MTTVADAAALLAAEFRSVGIYRTGDTPYDMPASDYPLDGTLDMIYVGPVCVIANNSLRGLGDVRYDFERAIRLKITTEDNPFPGLVPFLNDRTDAEVLAVLDSIAKGE